MHTRTARKIERRVQRQTDREIDRQSGRERRTERQTEMQKIRWADRHTDTDKTIGLQTPGWVRDNNFSNIMHSSC